jgi:hypothetical protein
MSGVRGTDEPGESAAKKTGTLNQVPVHVRPL